MENTSTLVLIALMVVAFYLLILRPQKKRQQAIQNTLNSLTPGSRVLLGSGLFGTIIRIGDRQAVLEISPGVELTVLKQAIVRTVTDADEDSAESDDELDDDELYHPELSEPINPALHPEADAGRDGATALATDDTDGTDGTDRQNPSAGADPKRLG